MVPAAFQQIYDDAERCLKRAIEVSNRVFSVVVIIFFLYTGIPGLVPVPICFYGVELGISVAEPPGAEPFDLSRSRTWLILTVYIS